MLHIEIVAFDNASVSEDEVETPLGLEDVVGDRSEGGVCCHV